MGVCVGGGALGWDAQAVIEIAAPAMSANLIVRWKLNVMRVLLDVKRRFDAMGFPWRRMS